MNCAAGKPQSVFRQHCQAASFAALACCTAVVFALPEDRDQPITLTASQANFNQRTGVSTYSGAVELTQGSMRLSAEKATVVVKEGAIETMHATGAPTQFRYQPTVDKPIIEGTGDRIEYDGATESVVLRGSANFKQGGDNFSGEIITYDLKNDLVNARGKGADGRIRITLQPRKKKDDE